MGLLDKCSPVVCKAMTTCALLIMAAVFVAMCVAAPSAPLLGEEADLSEIDSGDTAWILFCTTIVLLMTPGVCFLYCGLGDHKNVVSTIMQALMPMAVVPFFFIILGYGLIFGPSVNPGGGIFGDPSPYALTFNIGAAPVAAFAPTIPGTLFWMFMLVFAIITPAIIIGSVADRVNCSAMCIFVALWHLLVYCPLAHMCWNPTGLIRQYGVLDFAGGTVVHVASGWSALVAAIYLGKPADHDHAMFEMSKEPANVPYVVLGTAILWVGWFGFESGCAYVAGAWTSHVLMACNLAAATAMGTWVFMDHLRGQKMRATGACIAAIIGLVAITPAAGYVNFGAACLIGMIAVILCVGAQELMERYGRRYVHDTLDVFLVHGIGGSIGFILTSLFATPAAYPGAVGAFYGYPLLLGKTLLVLLCIIPWICIFTWGCLWVTDKILSLRVSAEDMMIGLDLSKHGERAQSIGDIVGLNMDVKKGQEKLVDGAARV